MSSVTRKYSISIPEDLAESVRAKVGPGNFSAFVTALIEREVQRGNLRELIDAAELQHGPVDRAAVEARRAALRGEALDGEMRDSEARDGANAGTRSKKAAA
ncbi:CopG family transcriptional regulator [Streptomyces candidus]|uniref:Arc/MetJ-type ribon-helix-helix transcriptional regulator n=1 Tax=Streptomyces candidus TaxID=67283 RepID=A0A7X0LNM6_9ACTN|nr:CopG family transcriptional regulator [Streptomyces candidus]MBB6434011.1 Arc/MetJ-type ribon-helix-helix transcriptional regulator [Streptomyces candidus]